MCLCLYTAVYTEREVHHRRSFRNDACTAWQNPPCVLVNMEFKCSLLWWSPVFEEGYLHVFLSVLHGTLPGRGLCWLPECAERGAPKLQIQLLRACSSLSPASWSADLSYRMPRPLCHSERSCGEHWDTRHRSGNHVWCLTLLSTLTVTTTSL